MENPGNSKKQESLLILMSTITLMAILCELVPSGVLPQMSKAYGVGPSRAGNLVGMYAVASALCGLPLVTLTVSWNRKRLLFILLLGFSISNLIVGLAPSLELALVGRILGGICAGTLWPMITAYGMALVDSKDQGRAVTIIMSGITVGMSLGLPIMTWIGRAFGYQMVFFILGICLFAIALACQVNLPSVPGEARSKGNSLVTMLKNSGVRLVVLLTFLAVGSNYGLYTYITNLVTEIHYPGVALAQIFFGIGSVISVLVTMNWIDNKLHTLMIALFATGLATMTLLYFGHQLFLFHAAFFVWGLAFGSMSSLFQTATAHQVTQGTAVANALQSASFNFSIMIGATSAGIILEESGLYPMILVAIGLLLLGLIIVLVNKKCFG